MLCLQRVMQGRIMSRECMPSEFFVEFIIEAREYLQHIEPALLELEKYPDDPALIDDIFRFMHSMKGASGFLGLAHINALTHKVENVLDELRKGTMRLTPDTTDIILLSTDGITAMVNNLEAHAVEGEVETAAIIAKIDALLQSKSTSLSTGDVPMPSGFLKTSVACAAQPSSAGFSPVTVRDACPETAYSLALANQTHLDDFFQETRAIVEQLKAALPSLEKNSGSGTSCANDMFCFFHRLKGNSGILGYNELTGLTHEAETLLNRVRRKTYPVTAPLVDLLFAVTDAIDILLACITPDGIVVPVDISAVRDRMRDALATGKILPAGNLPDDPVATKGQSIPLDPEDLLIFSQTLAQQFDTMDSAFSSLKKDSSQTPIIDALYRSFATIRNAATYMGMDELGLYVEGVVRMVDHGRSGGADFATLLDRLEQERDIIRSKVNTLCCHGGGMPLESSVSTGISSPLKEGLSPDGSCSEISLHAEGSEVSARSGVPVSLPGAEAEKVSRPLENHGNLPAGFTGLSSTIRVDHTRLDHLMNLIGELIINRNRFAMLVRGLQDGQNVNGIARQLNETTYSVGRISDELQDTIMKVRMVPVGSLFSRFRRLVRDLSRGHGKMAELIIEGEDTELDKNVVEGIEDPLIHLIRNALDHGIESADDRIGAGKPASGRVWLRAFHRGNFVGIEVEDDGRGIHPDTMRDQALSKGIVTKEELRTLDDRAALDLMFTPGFSTAEHITDISGRGVGMDVVRTNIKKLKGSISVHSEPGKGTRICMTVPLTLAIIDALLIRVGNAVYALPLDFVSETIKIKTQRLCEVNGHRVLTLRGQVLGLVDLGELLGLPPVGTSRDLLPTVILTVNDSRLGLVVDALLERQDVVIKPLGEYLGGLPGISGATILGDGSVVLILDPHEIYRMAMTRSGT